MKVNIEALRAIVADRNTHLSLAVVEKLELLEDFSILRVQCKTIPDETEVVATVTFAECSQGGGIFQAPQLQDLLLLAFTSPDDCFVITRLSSKDDLLPETLLDGNLYLKSKVGKKIILESDTEFDFRSANTSILVGTEKTYIGTGAKDKEGEPLPVSLETVIGGAVVHIGKGDLEAPPTQPAVLGTVTLEQQGKIYDHIIAIIDKLVTGPLGMGNLGAPVPMLPALIAEMNAIKTAITADKSTYVTTASTNLVSQTVFVER